MREGWRRIVVLAFSVLLLAGVAPRPPVIAAKAAAQLVAKRVVEWVPTQPGGHEVRVDDRRGTAPGGDARRAAFPPPHLLAAAGTAPIACAMELERASIAPAAHIALPSQRPLPVRARGPPSLALSA